MSWGKAMATSAWRGRAPVWIGIVAIVALSWAYLTRLQVGMSVMTSAMRHHPMPMPEQSELTSAFLMWTIMMVAMMVPTTAQSLSVFMALTTRRSPHRSLNLAAGSFVSGYVAAWTGYSALAATSQVELARAAFFTPMVQSTSLALSAFILLAAGLFQFAPLKQACLAKCRTPLGFFLAEWRDGAAGAFAMGLRHGSFCVGCCWALMAVVFVVGAMNLLWMAAMTIFMLTEKLAPSRWQLSRVAGVAFVMCGVLVAINLFR